MPLFIDNLPFGSAVRNRELNMPDDTRRIARRDTIILWASITGLESESLSPDRPAFPMLLDTGFNDSVLMSTTQALAWGPRSLEREIFKNGSFLIIGGDRIDLYEAAIWLWPNIPGEIERDVSSEPLRLDLANGIALATPGSKAVREYPLLGLLAIRFAELQVSIDGVRERVSISTL